METHYGPTAKALGKNRQWILDARPVGKLTGKEFRWHEASIPQPSAGQVLVRNLWLSVDPAQRIWMWRDSYFPKIPIGDVMASFAVGQVLESRHPDFDVGDIVRGCFGWQDYVATDGKVFGGMHKVPPGAPPNLALSLFGVNGLTAYFGITEVGQVKAGETVVVSGAAGATGSIAGQIAKIKGCRVIGTAGSKEKCEWLLDEGHFDAAIDYKTEDLRARLSALCPNGIDVFFDNVGAPSLTRYSHASTSTHGSRCAVRSRYTTPPRRCLAPPITPTLCRDARASWDLPGLIILPVSPRPSRHSVAGSTRANSSRRRTSRSASKCATSVHAAVYRREFRQAAGENRRCSGLTRPHSSPRICTRRLTGLST
jgi:NADPH-dependent curcumin reductase CurA